MAENQTLQAQLNAQDAAVTLGCAGYGGAAIQLTGSFTATVAFEASTDGVSYRAIFATPTNSTTQVTSATAAGLWTVNAVGLHSVRARVSAFSSGIITTTLRAVVASPGGSSSGGGGGGGTSSTFGDPFPATGTAAGFKDNSGNMAGGTLDASGNLKVAGTFSSASVGPTGSAVPADADYIGVKDSSGNLLGVAATNLDFDTGAGTVAQTIYGIALPANGGPVAGGTTTNPLAVTGSGTAGTAAAGVVTVQGIASMTKLLVTPDANSAVNVAQIAGTTTTVNTGAVGNGTQRVVQANDAGKTLASKGGSASSSGDNTLVAAGTNKLKVFAFSLTTTTSTSTTCIFQSGASGTELWRVVLQGPGSVTVGANLAVTPPAYLFATASATLLNLNLSAAQTVMWSVSYFDEA